MKKLDSNQDKESLQKEVKRLRKENKKLVSQKDKLKAKYEKTQKELKKRRSLTLIISSLSCAARMKSKRAAAAFISFCKRSMRCCGVSAAAFFLFLPYAASASAAAVYFVPEGRA